MADHDSRSHAVLAVTSTVIVASSIFVALRMVSRLGLVHRFSWDDYFMVIAWLLAFGLSFSICYGTSRGLGLHDVDIADIWIGPLRRSEYTFSVLYNPALMATKTSILMFYLTLSKTEKVFRWLSIGTLAVVNIAGIALTLLNVFQCRPFNAVFLSPAPASAQCFDIIGLYLGSAPVNIITDLAILFLPMPILTGMRLPRKQKTILVFTFALGGFVAVVDVVRIYYLQNAALQRLQQLGNGNRESSRIGDQVDFAYFASLSFMWSAVEVNVGIICACIPTLKPLFNEILPRLLHDSNDPVHSDRAAFTSIPSPTIDRAHGRGMASSEVGSSTLNSPTPHPGFNEGGDMDMMDFLTTPDMATTAIGSQAAPTILRTGSNASTFFDFVDMQRRKSMVKMTNRESYVPLALVTILFFLWGFAYGILDVLNAQFQLIVQLTDGQSIALHGAYYAGYFIAPLTFGRLVLKQWGFKATFITGLCVYGCGTLVFWPSAVLTSFPAFLISNLIVGMGLATLEVGANPFIALCGPPQYAERRLNISQAIQAVATVVSPILARRVLFRNVLDAPSLVDVQWTYLGIALFVVLLAVAFYYMPLPEASDDDLEEIAARRQSIYTRKLGPFPVIHVTLVLGVFSQFCYVGGQEAVATAFNQYVSAVSPNFALAPADYQDVAHGLFAAGRFIAAVLNLFLTPRWILLYFYTGCIITSALAMHLHQSGGLAAIGLVFFFESAIFPTIFAITLRGLGRHTKSGSACLVAAVSGGAIFPAIMSPVIKSKGIQYAMCVVVAVFTFGTLFPIYLCSVPAARAQVNPVMSSATKHSKRKRNITFEKWGKRKSDLPAAVHVERAEKAEDEKV